MGTGNKIRVLIVDDSALFRSVLSRGISADPELEVVATAMDPFDARDKIIAHEPDVMICDVVMPRMDGIEFIRRLLPQYPLRVVVVSSVSASVLDAMNAGAVDFVAKPDPEAGRTPAVFLSDLISKIKIAAAANLPSMESAAPRRVVSAGADCDKKMIAIGASTGGTEAIFRVLQAMPAHSPGMVITQHIPPVFSRMFAERLNNFTQLSVKEAQTGDFVETGHVLVAPGDKHMRVKKLGDRYRVEVAAGEKRNGHCPSVDVLFESVAAACGEHAVGVILTGMGADGAKGLLAMRQRGARTFGQDEKSCVVYGMPKVAFELGAVERQVPLDSIAQAITQAAERIQCR